MRPHRALLALAVLGLANCGTSPKTHYFTLEAVPAPQPQTVSITAPVTVAAVHVPPSLDRREMVRRTGTNTVDVSGEDRWTAPLGDMIRSVLSQDLATRLPKEKLVLPDAPAPPHTSQLVVSIARFGSDGNGKVALDGSWSVTGETDGTPALRRDFSLTAESPAAGPDGQAAAMSRLLGELATRIADTLAGAA
jgi:uncharacterized lipoprotein YmbA